MGLRDWQVFSSNPHDSNLQKGLGIIELSGGNGDSISLFHAGHYVNSLLASTFLILPAILHCRNHSPHFADGTSRKIK